MYKIGRKSKQKKAFSLVEILVSLAIFSVIITSVISLTLSMVNAQKNVQAKMFLAQTAQTTLEAMSRQIRYGYAYTGSASSNDLQISLELIDVSQAANSTASSNEGYAITNTVDDGSTLTGTTSYQLSTNVPNSNFIIFESQSGNPKTFADQNAFCVKGGMLYKVSEFTAQSNQKVYESSCDSGSPMLPENITIEKMVFDIYSGDVQNPKNPMVRIRMRLKHELGGVIDMETTVTQRLVTYF